MWRRKLNNRKKEEGGLKRKGSQKRHSELRNEKSEGAAKHSETGCSLSLSCVTTPHKHVIPTVTTFTIFAIY